MSNSRALIIIGLVFVFFIILIAKLFDIQIIKSEGLKYYAQRQQVSVEKIKAERGLIYDRNNVLLVYNRNNVSFYVYRKNLTPQGRKLIADTLSSIFGKSKKYYYDLMNSSRKTVCLQKKAPAEKAILLKNFRVNGLYSYEEPTRVYYYKGLASHVLGYVGYDHEGVNGIAKTFNNILSGEDGSRVILKDARGAMITVVENQTKPAIPGLNLVLTINKTYQAILEQQLENGLKKYEGTTAVGIIMDPNTGEILALADIPDYDPNHYGDYTNSIRRDRVVTDTYEPGSTFKTFSMSALLDRHLVKPNDIVNVEGGHYKFKNVYISDTHPNNWITVKQVVEYSSNVGMSKLIQKLDDDSFYKYVRAFGFGNYTSIPLPGESKGKLRKPNDWSKVTKAFMSFGYGLAVTPIQLITAYCAVVNGGLLYQPELIKREVRKDGTVVMENSPKLVRRVISEKTSATMKNFLVGVVEHGTGEKAQLKMVKVGGKTGTSQKLIDGKYSKMDYNSSFVGFFPADNPKIVCLILVNSPKIGRYGGSVAAPIFKEVTEQILNANPDLLTNPGDELKNDDPKLKVVFAENKNADEENLTPTAKRLTGKSLNLVKKNKMPDLTNYSLRDAIFVLNKIGIKYKVRGSGKVVAQSISAGQKIHKGLLVTLECKETQINGAVVY